LLLLLFVYDCRCSDKSAVVRARALSDLAEVVDCFASLLAEDLASEQHQVAEAFVEGLGAAAALQVRMRQVNTRWGSQCCACS
jgi:hypothetical protein